MTRLGVRVRHGQVKSIVTSKVQPWRRNPQPSSMQPELTEHAATQTKQPVRPTLGQPISMSVTAPSRPLAPARRSQPAQVLHCGIIFPTSAPQAQTDRDPTPDFTMREF